MRLSRTLLIAVVAGGFASLGGVAQAVEQEKLGVSEKQPFGKYLSSDEGRAIYMFTADQKGASACYDACAQAWPPVTTSGKAAAKAGVNAAMLGVIKRKDGTEQVTYNGMPLYYFARDQKPVQPWARTSTTLGASGIWSHHKARRSKEKSSDCCGGRPGDFV